MYIIDIKEVHGYGELYKVAVERYKNHYGQLPGPQAIVNSFNWSTTPEGHTFWDNISNGMLKRSKQDYPDFSHYFNTKSVEDYVEEMEEDVLKEVNSLEDIDFEDLVNLVKQGATLMYNKLKN